MLFTRKAQAALKKPDTQVKEEESILVDQQQQILLQQQSLHPQLQQQQAIANVEKPKSPKKAGRTKRNSNRKSVDSGDGLSVQGASNNTTEKKKSPISGGPMKSPRDRLENIPDSFLTYRAQGNPELSDSDESRMSYTESTCSSCSGGFSDSCSRSEFG